MLDVWLGSEYAFGLPLDFYPGISEIMRTSIFRIISNGLVLVALHFFLAYKIFVQHTITSWN